MQLLHEINFRPFAGNFKMFPLDRESNRGGGRGRGVQDEKESLIPDILCNIREIQKKQSINIIIINISTKAEATEHFWVQHAL